MEHYIFHVFISEDGAVTYSRQFDNALEAVKLYDSVKDYGFAKYEREVVLLEPNGVSHTKTYQAYFVVGSR
jgi:hypothetical protein